MNKNKTVFVERMDYVKSTKWLDIFTYKDSKHKTWTYYIFTHEQVIIGEIKWYAPWRQFAFYPRPNTVFEKQCLTDITNFVIEVMDKWKASKKKNNKQ